MTWKERMRMARELLRAARKLAEKENGGRRSAREEGRTAAEEIPFGGEKFLLDNGFKKTEDANRRISVYRRDKIIVTVMTGRYNSHTMTSRIEGGPVVMHYESVRNNFRQLYKEAFMSWKESYRPYPRHLRILEELCGKFGMNVRKDTIRALEYELRNRMR